MALHLAQVIAELRERVLLCREAKGGPDGCMDLRRPPAAELASAPSRQSRNRTVSSPVLAEHSKPFWVGQRFEKDGS
jgi:hypothetical protein